MKRLFFLLIFGIILILFPSCLSIKKNTTTSSSKLSEKDRINLKYKYYDASKEKILGNYDVAAEYYFQCLKIDNHHAPSMYELANIFASQGKYNIAIQLVKKATLIEPKNKWYAVNLAELYQKNRQFDKAISVFKNLVKEYPNHLGYYYEWASTLLVAGKYKEAIEVYDIIENKTSISMDLSIQKERIYIELNDIENAIKEIVKVIESYPNEPELYEELANLYQMQGLNEKALETYEKIVNIEPNYAQYHLLLANYYRNIGDKEKSFFELKRAFSNPELDIDNKIQILLSYYVITEKYDTLKTQAFTLNQILVNTHPNDPKSHAMYADFLSREDKYQEAREEYRKAIRLDSSKYNVWNQLLFCESELKDFNALLEESDKAKELFPNQPLLYLFNGFALTQVKRYQEAIDIYNQGKELVVENNPLLLQFHSNLGYVYNRNKNYTQSDSAYDMALAIDSNDATILNNYSYYLSLRKELLEKAEKMSKKADSLAPNTPSYQDTYGWILYQMGKYDTAKIWIAKALEGNKNNGVILEHYGDILYQLGKKEEAYQYWNKAKEKGGGSEWLDKKIVEKKLYE